MEFVRDPAPAGLSFDPAEVPAALTFSADDPPTALEIDPMATARNATAVTPHDTNALSPVPDALYVGVAGNVVLRARGSSADVTMAAVAGGYLLVSAQYVRATGTTATGITGLFL